MCIPLHTHVSCRLVFFLLCHNFRLKINCLFYIFNELLMATDKKGMTIVLMVTLKRHMQKFVRPLQIQHRRLMGRPSLAFGKRLLIVSRRGLLLWSNMHVRYDGACAAFDTSHAHTLRV
ncbi:hypothetical protein AAZX31_15G156300 [Glycine max]|uniref:Uncharacterized protein n=3 Tax=Glycine subgen. Soja TaxID=1462606 RepID=K7MBS4_SOYBN|nr:hypothetical protein JHK87_042451 [Glycine soja]KAG4949312.1 hypothetical protein JHK86_042551 [Glycine max]KAG4956801.1 hypothetical protein JHK85_043181 [Glycine max]KAG5105550.1 hypothetical protein JHK82_042520 [Glycine max]KAG5116660.1 hypothetical protein JHK84_042773 [Glycine max]